MNVDKERRIKLRFPLQLNVRYQAMGVAGLIAGVGKTLNMSSTGILIACNSDISEGTRVSIVIEWPSLLNGTTPLHLATVGTVVRRQGYRHAIALDSYQFRTAGRRANVATMPATRVLPTPSFSNASVASLPMAAKSAL